MDLETIKSENMEIVKAKGFAATQDVAVVAERIALLHSEISEMYDAFLKGNLNGKDGFYEEAADVLLRTLHLAGIFNILCGEEVSIPLPDGIDDQVAILHKMTSESYEHFRHKRIEEFKRCVHSLAWAVVSLAVIYGFNLETEVKNKMAYNKTRVWNKTEMNETSVS